jgi:hypothetical protein
MKRILSSVILVLALAACEDPNDSEECKDWQVRYAAAGTNPVGGDLIQAGLLGERPDGCDIP